MTLLFEDDTISIPMSPTPFWYMITENPEGVTIGEEEWEEIIDDRLLLYKDGNHKTLEFGLSKQDKQDLGKRERIAFTIMKLAVCLDPRLSVWFVETEGDLFEQDFRNLRWKEKVSILDNLYTHDRGKDIWMTLSDLSLDLSENITEILGIKITETQRFHSKNPLYRPVIIDDTHGMGNYIALDYRYGTELIKSRKAILHKGWVIAPLSRFITTIKHHYQKLIEDSLADYATRLENPKNHQMKQVAERVNELLHEKVVFKRSSVNLGPIHIEGGVEKNINILPPCIEDLLSTVEEVGYIGHWERLQLGIFLKFTGMDVEEQLLYWYNKAVDNINMSYDDFLKKAGYVIKHIYGLVGGKVDYQMPTCATIQAKMYCTFKHADMETINQRVVTKLQIFSKDNSSLLEQKKSIGKRILDASTNSVPFVACAYHLELICGARVGNINHPLYYLRRAGSVLGGYSLEEEKNA